MGLTQPAFFLKGRGFWRPNYNSVNPLQVFKEEPPNFNPSLIFLSFRLPLTDPIVKMGKEIILQP